VRPELLLLGRGLRAVGVLRYLRAARHPFLMPVVARVGIETSYRQLSEARATTCSRRPPVRLFLVGAALLPRNVWVWLHHAVPPTPRRGRRRYHPERPRFKDLLPMLLHAAELASGVCDQIFTERATPIGVETTSRSGAG
jgi:putative transposase